MDGRQQSKIVVTPIPELLDGAGLTGGDRIAARAACIRDCMARQGENRALRVLIATNTLGRGGAEHQVLRLMPRLHCLGLEPEHLYYAPWHDLREQFDAEGLRTHFLDRDVMGRWRFMQSCVRLIKSGAYDVVHAFSGTANIYIRAAAIVAGHCVIVGGWRSRLMRRLVIMPISICNWRTSAWIVNSITNCEALAGLWGMGKKRVYVAPNAIELNGSSDTVGRPLPEPVSAWIGNRRAVCAVGRFSSQKNYDMLLDVAAEVQRRAKAICFCIVGGAENLDSARALEQRIRGRLSAEKLENVVRLLGPSEDVTGLLPNFAMLVSTSNIEGCPNVVIEALRAALPVVMTASADTSLLIDEGENGFVVPCGDVAGMASRIIEVLEGDRLGAYGVRSRELAEAHFDADDAAWRYARVYLSEWIRSRSVGPGRGDG